MSDPALPSSLANAAIPPAVMEVIEGLGLKGHAAYLVGGCVRDLIRGKQPQDYDVATSATPEQVIACFRRVIPTGIAHGTVTVHVGKTAVEVTTFRAEGAYVDGRRPSEVHFHKDVVADLSRRDFTFNAMAFNPVQKAWVDPFNGVDDLARRCVRCVGTAMERFSEDGLRALRAVRFATVLDCTIDPDTAAAIPPTIPIFKKVAVERVREELQKILLSPRVGGGLQLLADTGLLDAFWPELAGLPEPARASAFVAASHCPPGTEERLTALMAWVEARTRPPPWSMLPGPQPAEATRAALTRLKYPSATIERTVRLVRHVGLLNAHNPTDVDLEIGQAF